LKSESNNSDYQKNDPRYLLDSDYENPKESYKHVLRLIQSSSVPPENLLDVGCASGAFLKFVQKNLPQIKLWGLDHSAKLLEKAQACVPGPTYVFCPLEESSSKIRERFHVVTSMGVFGCLNEIEPGLTELLGLVSRPGRILIWDAFNPDPVDVIVRLRDVTRDSKAPFGGGYNVFSELTFERTIKNLESKSQVRWHKSPLPFPVAKTENPLRQWTISTEYDPYHCMLGTGQLLTKKILEITLP
jgi:trans-aconitate methyltransferase